MALLDGLDSAYPPTLQQAQLARQQGYVWWAFYLPKLPNTDPLNGWTPAQVQVLREAGIAPVPICVPAPPAPADAVQTATDYVALCKEYGLNPLVAICYNGEHINVNGSVWLPRWGPKPASVGSGSAIQYGDMDLSGLDVDTNVASMSFPMSNGLVCDLESNVRYTAEWYSIFQATVVQLAATRTLQEDTVEMQIGSNGTVYICGNATDNGDLMLFSVDGGKATVDDLTQAVHNSNPSDTREYKIS